MKNRTFRIFGFFISCLLLIFFSWSLVKHVDFFCTKTEAVGEIVTIDDLGLHNPYNVTIKYFNVFARKNIVTTVTVKKSNEMKIKQNTSVIVYYSKHFSNEVYLAGINTPRILILLIDVLLVALMVVAIKSFKSALGIVSKGGGNVSK